MNDCKRINEDTISDIILCEPITRKGIEALNKLGLTTTEISPSFFYEHLRVASKYDKDKEYEQKILQDVDTNILYYQYTTNQIQFKELKDRYERFVARFFSDSPNEYPLLMLGVAGNGKSIEVNRHIHEIISGTTEYESDKVYLDLEDTFTKKTYGITYECPGNTSLWVFCIKLLDEIMKYIKSCHLSYSEVLNNFNNIVVKENLANDELKRIFQCIGNYQHGNQSSETKLFGALIGNLSSGNPSKNIEVLLEILMWVMYCTAPNRKHYIIIDNIEQYIELNGNRIQIPNSDITKLYNSIKNVVANMISEFNRIRENLGWKAFKIIIVLRRTTLGLLDAELLHAPVKAEQNITDITGYFQVPDIWREKKKYIWEEKLRSQFNDSENEKIIEIVEMIMNDGVNAKGIDYQALIAPLMSYGIRRNAKAQAHAAYSMYEVLTNGNIQNINWDEYKRLMSAIGGDNTSGRYMFRRALIEFQFKWAISSGRQDRWRNLGIGHLTKEKLTTYNGKRFMVENVEYYDKHYVTLMRRILVYLSYFPEENRYSNGQYRSAADMFLTRTLFDLVQGVLVNPRGEDNITDNDFLNFSRVHIALSDMSNGDTKSAPYVILSIADRKFHKNSSAFVLAKLLKKIWKAGPEKSRSDEEYNDRDYGVRITDSGNSFLLDWQASFSLIASLHCFTVPSLFFLKDINMIEYVIKTVYDAANELCQIYENEARSFCGTGVTLKTRRGKYLQKHNDQYVTFKQRVKELHINHLYLYRDFIEKNNNYMGISEKDRQNLTGSEGIVYRYIKKYSSWNTEGEVPECF